MRPTRYKRRQGNVGPLALCLLAASLFSGPAGSNVVTCGGTQRVPVADGRPWRCQVDLQANHAYLLRATRQTRDVSLEVIGADAKRVVKVDSPTVRAGPELLYFSPRVAGKYTLVVAPVDRGLPTRTLDIEWRELSGVAPDSSLARGLTNLTSAAALADAARPDDGQRRLAMLRSASSDLRAARADAYEAETLLRVASIYFWTLGDWTRSAESAALAAEAFDRISDPIMSLRARALHAESLIEGAGSSPGSAKAEPKAGLTQFDEAQRILTDCARRFAAAGMKYDQAAAINYLGVSAHYRGRLTEARGHYETAARMFAELGESASEVQSLQNIAVIDIQRGDYLEAVAAYKRLLGKLDSEGNLRTYLAILNNLAIAQYVLGQTDDALKSLLAALPLTESRTTAGDRARTLHSLGRIYLILGEQERGEVFLGQALDLRQSKTLQDRQGLLDSLVAIADLKRDTGDPQRALKLHMQALDQAVSPQEKARVLLAIGQDQMAAGSVSAAVDTFARALKLDLPKQSTARYRLMGAYGYARSRDGDPDGRALLLQAAQAQETTGDDNDAAQNYALLASEERRGDQIEAASRHVDKALSLYDAQRIRAVNPDLRATYISNRADAYELQADLYMTLWQRSSNPADKERLASSALGTAERLRTLALEDFRQFAQQPARQRDTAGAAALAELDSRLAAKRHRLATLLDLDQPPAEQIASLRREIALLRTQLDVAQEKEAPSTKSQAATVALSLPKLQASLGGDVAMVTWLLGEERSWIWCITQNSAAAFSLEPGKNIETAARDLYTVWSRPPDGKADREREVKASRAILGPAGTASVREACRYDCGRWGSARDSIRCRVGWWPG